MRKVGSGNMRLEFSTGLKCKTNGLIEAINGLIQAAKRKARGYRTTRNLITMIYLVGAKIEV
nr:transposase [Ferroacidibacillus organovorans]